MNLKEPKKRKDMKTVVDYAYYHRYRYLMYQEKFRILFKKPLKDFWEGNLTGFDIVSFDKWVNPEQKRICKDVVAEKYGEEAAELIKKLM